LKEAIQSRKIIFYTMLRIH